MIEVNCFVFLIKVLSSSLLFYDSIGRVCDGRIAWLSHSSIVSSTRLLSNGSLDRSTFMLRHFLYILFLILSPVPTPTTTSRHHYTQQRFSLSLFSQCVYRLDCISFELSSSFLLPTTLLYPATPHRIPPQRSNKLLKYPIPLLLLLHDAAALAISIYSSSSAHI